MVVRFIHLTTACQRTVKGSSTAREGNPIIELKSGLGHADVGVPVNIDSHEIAEGSYPTSRSSNLYPNQAYCL